MAFAAFRIFGWAVAVLGVGFSSAATMAQAVFVTRFDAPPPGVYDRSISLHFTATFNVPVVVSGAPRLALRIGNAVRHATVVTPLGPTAPTTKVIFEYVPATIDRDGDGIEVTPVIELNGGAIQGVDAAPAQLTFWAPDTHAIRIDALPTPTPRVMSLTSATPRDVSGSAPKFFVNGTADGGSRVTVSLVDVGVVGTTSAAANGAWSLPYSASLLTPGTHELTATAENSAGVTSAESAPLEVRIAQGPSR